MRKIQLDFLLNQSKVSEMRSFHMVFQLIPLDIRK